jgi:hypothetical protein
MDRPLRVERKHHYYGAYVNKLTFTLILLSTLFSLTGCAGLEPAPEDAGIRTKVGKEILVVRDVGKGEIIYSARWCGSNAFIYKSSGVGIEWIDIKTRERVQVSPDSKHMPIGCTSDGEWVVYEKLIFIPNPMYKEYDGPVENRPQSRISVHEVYSYEVATGKRRKFASMEGMDSRSEWVSPDGKKILLSPPHPSLLEKPEPWLEEVWFGNDNWWDPHTFVWFPDSSGAVTLISNPLYDIGVEFFGDGGWSGAFKFVPEYGVLTELTVDTRNRIYYVLEFITGLSDVIPAPDIDPTLHRCSVEGGELVCEEILERDDIARFVILSDGDIVFQELYDNCIRRVSPGETDAGCMIGRRYGNDVYEDVSLIGISPDGRWLAIKRSSYDSKPDDRYFNYRADLFLIELVYE